MVSCRARCGGFFGTRRVAADQFIRIHRSYFVSIECVARIEQAGKASHHAALRDGTRLAISRSGYQRIRAAMQ